MKITPSYCALAVCLVVGFGPSLARAQDSMVQDLLRENQMLRAEVLRLKAEIATPAASQCAPAKDTSTAALLMQKLAQIKDDSALAALGPPPSPVILPDRVLSALVPNQYILTLRNDADDLARPQDVAAAFGLDTAQIGYVYRRVLRGFSAQLTAPELEKLQADPRILSVTQDGFVFPAQEGVAQNGGVQQSRVQAQTTLAGAADVPALAQSADLVDVYVFDSGIRAAHQSLEGLVGQGFTSFRNGIGTEDCNGHGTHVAGAIGGRQFGQTGKARMISVKVLDRDSYGDVSTVIAGVEWVLDQPGTRKIANLSLTRLDPAPLGTALLDRAVLALIAAEIPVVVAAGNSAGDARLYSPARLPGVITVGAMAGEQVADSSNTGVGVDLYAQGDKVASASLADNCAFERMSGTSMSAARVTGVAAEMLASGTPASALLTQLLGAASAVETGEFAGEVLRYVLPLRDGELDKLCEGQGLEVRARLMP